MIDIVQYRCQIGLFKQKIFSNKFLNRPEYEDRSDWTKMKSGEDVIAEIKTVFKIIILCTIFLPSPLSCFPYSWCVKSCAAQSTTSSCTAGGTTSDMQVSSLSHTLSIISTKPGWSAGGAGIIVTLHTSWETGNFWAKYIHGNIMRSKGVHNMHFNIRSLKYKVGEIKNLVHVEKPTILGLSECELKREAVNPNSLKIPGYEILFPKSWETQGFARVLVYVKKTFSYEQVHDLEDSLVQSVWIRGSFRNSSQIYFCHAYREHASAIGGSINNQKEYLNKFLSQWEAATEHNSAVEPNEVHISGDMNLDYLPTKWLQPSYRLYSLTKLVNSTCNAYNFSQLVQEPTRVMFNSVANTTEVSCIDHVYSNYRHKCSPPRVIVSGASDHDILSYIRYSKGPSVPSRTIRRRSYKHFVEADYLADLGAVDWTDVLVTTDLDKAVDILTNKLNFILNQHAPWILF